MYHLHIDVVIKKIGSHILSYLFCLRKQCKLSKLEKCDFFLTDSVQDLKSFGFNKQIQNWIQIRENVTETYSYLCFFTSASNLLDLAEHHCLRLELIFLNPTILQSHAKQTSSHWRSQSDQVSSTTSSAKERCHIDITK